MKTLLLLIICCMLVPGISPAQPPNRPRPTASVETMIRNHAMLQNIFPYTGAPQGNKAFHSNGNKTDGMGYFMVGAKPTSFFYYVSRSNRVYANWGAVRDRFIKANYEFGMLGWPNDDEYLLPDGTGFFQRFDHGFIYSNPTFGTYIVKDLIFDHWAHNNWERGVFGYPVSEETFFPNSQASYKDPSKKEVYITYQNFQNGTIDYIYNKVTRQYGTVSTIKDPNFNPSRPH